MISDVLDVMVTAFLLAIDVGNSRIKFGLFDSAACGRAAMKLPECLRTLAVPVAEEVPWNEIRAWCDPRGVEVHGVLAGANPQGIARVVDTWPDEWPAPQVISEPTHVPIATRLIYPRRVGIDRVLNAVAANVVRPSGQSVIVVDSGTATTVDLVGPDGLFEGGAILPGFELCARALHYYTALLPLISMDELDTQSNEPLGRETRAALRSGLFWGQLGAVKELVARLSEPPAKQGPDRSAAGTSGTKPLVLLTGGGSGLLGPHLPEARFERFLSLQGLALSARATRS
ncbi:MAG: type III pantothenate kinase [Planctomycetaceae bacterium]|nr:type III pantothenate kinase [Planctomycetaceae bacterium]